MSYTRLTLLPSNQILSVEEGETILDAALRAGLNLPHSCKGGHCSSCRARILAGEVSYPGGQPLGITPDEARAGYTLLCQAHAASPELSVEIREIRPPTPEERIQSLPCRIEHMQALAPGVMAVFLRLPATETFTFVAGQYLDIMLPQISGLVVRQELAAHALTRQIPVVIVTGTATDLDPTDASCILRKPVSPDQLVITVRDCLAAASAARGVF